MVYNQGWRHGFEGAYQGDMKQNIAQFSILYI